ncbi:MAG TPA: PilZ domain-containing protein [Nitrospiraceae bacterium]|jgi:hypothetical protein|nr:PilZ domain-containing protein [Nitrospiraceae bacterium]
MEVTLPDLPAQYCQVREMDQRMDARMVVSFNTIVADKVGLTRGQVTNISRSGCGLCLTRLLRRDQYLTLKVYQNDGPAIQIDLGKVKWVEGESAGVEFLCVSPQNHGLQRLCGDQLKFHLET